LNYKEVYENSNLRELKIQMKDNIGFSYDETPGQKAGNAHGHHASQFEYSDPS